MTSKILPGPLVISMLPQLEAWEETRRQVIKSKMEIQGGFFSSKNQFNCCCLQRGQKNNKVTTSIADFPFSSQVLH